MPFLAVQRTKVHFLENSYQLGADLIMSCTEFQGDCHCGVIGKLEKLAHGQHPGNGKLSVSWWRHQMEACSALMVICAGNSPVTGEFPAQRPLARSFDIFFDLRLNIRLCKRSWGWWFETLSRPLWRHYNVAAKWSTTCLCYFAFIIYELVLHPRRETPTIRSHASS